MAFKHGSKAAVYYGGYDVSAYLSRAALSASMSPADTTTFGATWRTFIAGLLSAGYEFEGMYDPAEDVILQAALQSADNVLTVCPSGSALSDVARLVPVITSEYGLSDTIDEAVGISWGVTANKALAFGTIIHPLAEDTNTTTGSSIDQSAATSTGWTANLHVTAIDAGGRSWVITVEDSSTGSSGWATIATFAAKTAIGSERIVSAAATTAVKRYVRVVATASGGSAGQGITYALSFARTNQ